MATSPNLQDQSLNPTEHALAFLGSRAGEIDERGFQTGREIDVPLIIGSNHDALAVMQDLREHGLWVPAIRPPTVPKGTARLRISLSAAHTGQQVQQLLAVSAYSRPLALLAQADLRVDLPHRELRVQAILALVQEDRCLWPVVLHDQV